MNVECFFTIITIILPVCLALSASSKFQLVLFFISIDLVMLL